MKKALILVVFLISLGTAWAGPGDSYPQNQYQTYGTPGNVQTYGYSPSTGSSWSSQSNGGVQSGVNSQGQSWSYDRSSGVYQNYGTGETRFNQPMPTKKKW